jgi:hypothetical protein
VQELEFQETIIAEREAEIREIESGIHELNDIFRDLGTIVAEQGGLIGMSYNLHPFGWRSQTFDVLELFRQTRERWRRCGCLVADRSPAGQ